MKAISKSMKLFTVIVIAVLVIGIALLGIFGLNDTVDFKEGYEIQVSVDQTYEKACSKMRAETDKYLEANGIDTLEYSFQKNEDGSVLIYKLSKLDKEIEKKVGGLESHINAALDADAETKGTLAEVSLNKTKGSSYSQAGKILLAVGIGIVAIFLYLLIMEKLSSAVAVVSSSVLSMLVFVALMAITRLPAKPYFEAAVAFAGMFAAILSVSTVAKYKEEIKNADGKINVFAISEKVAKVESKKYLFAVIAVLVAAVAVSAFFSTYLMIMGAQLALGGIAAAVVSYFMTPFIWAIIKGRKKK